jgi:hypothetical protein
LRVIANEPFRTLIDKCYNRHTREV